MRNYPLCTHQWYNCVTAVGSAWSFHKGFSPPVFDHLQYMNKQKLEQRNLEMRSTDDIAKIHTEGKTPRPYRMDSSNA